jgi:hypothetical protein
MEISMVSSNLALAGLHQLDRIGQTVYGPVKACSFLPIRLGLLISTPQPEGPWTPDRQSRCCINIIGIHAPGFSWQSHGTAPW